ncbi:membrane protein [Rhodopseudomonas julia]|uniref:Membrane protein n=1 Tax=Rhodopseudomonas julia TaxID=200617 RepID=A0ABU0C5E4_9BRAD|nr:YihY/virulence factor BrkB family protein [Rhodopseudomonas julia]MDQ0325737.1 membrane protein [Rhodopseudomonas julia]
MAFGDSEEIWPVRLVRLIWRALRFLWRVNINAISGLLRHDGIMLASAIAFSLIFALFPFLLFLIALAGVFGGQELADYLTREAFQVMPEHMVKTIEPEVNRVLDSRNGGLITIGLLVTLVSITGAVEAVREALNKAYRCSDQRNFLHRYGGSVIFVFLGMAFLIVVSALGVALPIWLAVVRAYFPDQALYQEMISVGGRVILFLVMVAMLTSVHVFLPANHRRVRVLASGVILTVALWWVAGRIFSFYISVFANYSATYAGLGGIVALMFFLYIQALIFQYGAELNRAIDDEITNRKETWMMRHQLRLPFGRR